MYMKNQMEIKMNEMKEEEYIDLNRLPKPQGWKILVRPHEPENVSPGGIVLSDDTTNAQKYNTCVGKVLAMGHLCYTDDRFRLGERDPRAWCEVGSWVIYNAYNGQKLKMLKQILGSSDDMELLLINDDEVKAVVTDPYMIRAYV